MSYCERTYSKVLKFISEKNISYTGAGEGILLIEDKYLFAVKSGKWRFKNQNVWYLSAGIESFYNIIHPNLSIDNKSNILY